MSLEQNISAEKNYFLGEDKFLEYEVLMDDGKKVDDVTKGVEDVTNWTMVWTLRKLDKNGIPAGDAIIEKRTGGAGVSVVGVYNASRVLNTQRVRVVISDDDTDLLPPSSATVVYAAALKRLSAGGDAVISHGTIALRKSAAPAE